MSQSSPPVTPANDAAAVGARIRVAREAAHMSVSQLALRLGVEVASLEAWEAGQREPRANRLRTLGGVLGVSLAWLLEGRDDGTIGTPHLTVQVLRQRIEHARVLLAECTGVLEEIDGSLAALDPEDVLGDAERDA